MGFELSIVAEYSSSHGKGWEALASSWVNGCSLPKDIPFTNEACYYVWGCTLYIVAQVRTQRRDDCFVP